MQLICPTGAVKAATKYFCTFIFVIICFIDSFMCPCDSAPVVVGNASWLHLTNMYSTSSHILLFASRHPIFANQSDDAFITEPPYWPYTTPPWGLIA